MRSRQPLLNTSITALIGIGLLAGLARLRGVAVVP